MSEGSATIQENSALNKDLEQNVPQGGRFSRRGIPNQFEIREGLLEKLVAEYFGTGLFLLIAYLIADIANIIEPEASSAKTLLIAIGFGFGLTIAVTITASISGGHHNPAVSTTAWLIGSLNFVEYVGYWVAQILGGMTAGGIASALTPGPVLFANAKISAVSVSRGLFIEAAGTLILIVTVISCAIRPRFSVSNPPTVIGLSLFLAHCICVPTTGAGVNPARSFGAAVADRSFPGYFWIYFIGPLLAALAVAVFYHIYYAIFAYEEEEN